MTVSIGLLRERLRQRIARMVAPAEDQIASLMLVDLTIHEVMDDLDPGMLRWKPASDASIQLEEGGNCAPVEH